MARPIVTIDGKPVALFGYLQTAIGAVEPPTDFLWEVCFGTRTPVMEWELKPALAEYVLGQREVSIHMEGFKDRKPLDVKRAFVLGKTRSTNKRRIRVQFGDIRKTLEYSNPVAAFNLRAESGNNSLNGFDGTGKFIRQIPAFVYRLGSVNENGTPIRTEQVLKAVMDLSTVSPGDWVLDEPPRARDVPNNVYVREEPGYAAIARVLATIGGLDMYVDPADGLMHIKNRVNGDEKRTIESRFPADGSKDVEGRAKMVLNTMDRTRPRGFDGVFDPRLEIRANYYEGAAGPITYSQEADDFYCETVAEVMEYRPGFYQASTPDGPRQCLPGEYLNVVPYIATMPQGPLVTGMTLARLQEGLNNINLIYSILGDGQIPDPGEDARIRSLLACYRQIFRMNRRAVSRMRPGSLLPIMASVADAETSTYKPSDCYLDTCVIPTYEVALGNSTNALQGWNRDSFPPRDTTPNNTEKSYTDNDGANPTPLLQMRVAPFDVKMLPGGSSSGLFRLVEREDFQDERDSIVPCRILNIPTLDYTASNGSPALAKYFWDQCPVASQHRMTAILSAIPLVGSYHVPVSMADAAGRLGISAKPGTAPTMAVFLGDMEALFPWDDQGKTQRIEAFKGTFAGTSKDPLKFLTPSNLEVLKDYAQSSFAAILANYLPHYEGLQVDRLDGSALPTGSLQSIVHRIGPKGLATSTFNCMPVRDAFIADHFMKSSTLAILRRRVTTS